MNSMSSAGTSKNPSTAKDRAQPWMLAIDGLMAASLVVLLATGMTAPQVHAWAGVAFVVLAVVHGIPSVKGKRTRMAARGGGAGAPKKRPTRLILTISCLVLCLISGHFLIGGLYGGHAGSTAFVFWMVVHLAATCIWRSSSCAMCATIGAACAGLWEPAAASRRG